MKVYIVIVKHITEDHTSFSYNVSSEGYKTFAEAEEFILSRSDNPVKDSNYWRYLGKKKDFGSNLYLIKEIDIKE